ncbi:30S ribosomal protein S9, chloroplastic [Trifolium repens]|jgi:hypothetical protein|nr:30S ribosomal protein S9, chloroplastic [Trifolium repens]
MTVWAAKPPGSLDLTYFLRSAISGSARAMSAVVAVTVNEGNLGEREKVVVLGRKMEVGLREMLEEKESEEREDVRDDKETAMALAMNVIEVKKRMWLQKGDNGFIIFLKIKMEKKYIGVFVEKVKSRFC